MSHEKQSFKFIIDEMREMQIVETDLAKETTLEVEVKEIVKAQLSKQIEEETEVHPALQEEMPAAPTVGYSPIQLDPEKKYFRVGEVADLLKVEPYVLRYWENEFSMLKPEKSSSGHRVYTRKDLEMLHYIQYLLHVEKYSLKGAKAKLREDRQKPDIQAPMKSANFDFLKEVSKELKELIHIARGNAGTF